MESKYDTNELLYETETDSQRLVVAKGEGRGVEKGRIESLGLANANYYI